MTKSHKASAVAEKPARISICEQAQAAFAQAAILIRDGYSFCTMNPPQTFAHNGYATIDLVLTTGDDAGAAAAAAATLSIALARQKAQEHRVEAEALARTAAHQAREAEKERLAGEVAATRAHLQQLEAAHRTA